MDVTDNQTRNRFELALGDGVAFLNYRLGADTITFTYTEVPEAARGRGYGEALVRAALDSARRRNLRVVPVCRFVASFIQEHPEYRDLVVRDRGARR